VADLSGSWRHRRKILSILALAAIVALTWRAGIQTSYWKNSESIWTRTLAVTSNNRVAHEHLGLSLLNRGQLDDAIFHLQESLKIWPDFSQAHYEIGVALFRKGRIDEAMAHWQKTLSIHPDDPEAHRSLGNAFLQKRLVGEAVVHYEKSLEVAPESVATLNNLARVLSICPDAQFRNGSRAIQLAQQADQLAGRKNPLVVRTLAAAYAESGRFDNAIDAAQRALQLAIAQGNSTLASDLQMDIDLYRTNLPFRNLDLTNALGVR
jgi:protein O-mannosyl-transferase